MSKPGADPASGISLGDVLRRPKRHPLDRLYNPVRWGGVPSVWGGSDALPFP